MCVQCLCQFHLASTRTVDAASINIWLRNLVDYTTVYAFVSHEAATLMVRIGRRPVANVVEDPLPDLTVFALAISDALIAYSSASHGYEPIDTRTGGYSW